MSTAKQVATYSANTIGKTQAGDGGGGGYKGENRPERFSRKSMKHSIGNRNGEEVQKGKGRGGAKAIEIQTGKEKRLAVETNKSEIK